MFTLQMMRQPRLAALEANKKNTTETGDDSSDEEEQDEDDDELEVKEVWCFTNPQQCMFLYCIFFLELTVFCVFFFVGSEEAHPSDQGNFASDISLSL